MRQAKLLMLPPASFQEAGGWLHQFANARQPKEAVMKKTILLVLSPLVLAGCISADVPESVRFYYQAQGLCQGVKVTATVGGFYEGDAIQAIEGTTYEFFGFAHNNSITLPKGLSNTGYYRIAVSRPGGSNIYPTTIQLQCPSVSSQFSRSASRHASQTGGGVAYHRRPQPAL